MFITMGIIGVDLLPVLLLVLALDFILVLDLYLFL